jgi:hypothetical protein
MPDIAMIGATVRAVRHPVLDPSACRAATWLAPADVLAPQPVAPRSPEQGLTLTADRGYVASRFRRVT